MNNEGKTILVTGGAGYIGSHAVLYLKERGYDVVVLDNLVYGHRELVEDVLKVPLIVGDTGDSYTLQQIFKDYEISAVLHFAAFAYVGESVKDPLKYYRNNVANTLTLVKTMLEADVKNLVFSSTCATYGVPSQAPIPEDEPQNPINPYGMSKLMVERILQDINHAHELRSVCFRYFNAAGADPEGRLGEDHVPETHLIPLLLLTALGHRKSFSIFGTDYPTSDGTCVRDFIHVTDLANAHVLGLDYLLNGGEATVFNLGNGQGYSIRQVIEAARKVTGQEIDIVECDRRPGDPPELIGGSERAKAVLGWQPQYSNIETILSHAWNWHIKRHSTYS